MLAISRMATGISGTTHHLSGMQNVRLVSHSNSSHQQHSSTTPTQGWKKYWVKNAPRYDSIPPGTTIICLKNSGE